MRGPAVRAYQLGRELSDIARVTLAGPEPSEPPEPGLAHVAYNPHNPVALREPIAAADAVIAQPQWPGVTKWLEQSGARLIFDLFVPEPLEALERYRSGSWRGGPLGAYQNDPIADAFRIGHHFVCAGERQREYWHGLMGAVPDVVSYATPPEPALATGSGGARGVFPQLSGDDEIVLWPSAIWPWFDAETAVRAMALL